MKHTDLSSRIGGHVPQSAMPEGEPRGALAPAGVDAVRLEQWIAQTGAFKRGDNGS